MGFKGRYAFFLLFTLSGFSGLIYESIWTHYLKLFLGHAAYAQSLVLAIFMGGMAIGSWICSRYSSRWKSPLSGYALAEGVIGLAALVFHPAFAGAVELSYASVLPRLGSPALVAAFKWALSALMILPQSVLLGMTFPLMSAGLLRLFPERPGRTVALLYFTNSVGAAAGVLVSGFLLIGMVGLPGTVGITGLINLLLAATVWLLLRKPVPLRADQVPKAARRSRKGARAVPQSSGPGEQVASLPQGVPITPSVVRYRLLLAASLVTGTASFIYEIGWIRMLSLVLGSSTHSFELMLSAFILGLALGGLWIQRRIDRAPRPVRYLALVQVSMAVLALGTLLLYNNTFVVMWALVLSLPRSDAGYALFNLSSSAIAMAVMLPATFCAGMTLPLITFILLKAGEGERSIGAVYAANTVGAIIGVFFAIHLGLPFLGLKGLVSFGASLDLALGLALLWSEAGASGYRLPAAATAAGCCAVLATLLLVRLDPYRMGSGVYRSAQLFTPAETTQKYHRDGRTATVSCFLNNNGIMSITTNGKPDAAIMMAAGGEPTGDEVTMTLLAVIPMALHPQGGSAAAIGLGSGLTSHTLLSNPRMTRVDTVEIEQGMIEAANNFRPRVEAVYRDPRSEIHLEDAKTFFSADQRRYDLIVSEPSNPWVSGVAGLFSEEFYRMIKRHMTDDGLFVQWVQLYEIDVELVVSVLKAVHANFSDYAVYAADDGDIVVVARKKGALPAVDPGVLRIPPLAEVLDRIHVAGVQDIQIREIGTKRTLARLLESFAIRANSDYYPVLDQGAARTRFLHSSAQELFSLAWVLEMLNGGGAAREGTAVTATPYFVASRAAVTAMGLRDYFLRGSFGPGVVPEDLKEKAVLFKHVCAGTVESDQNERLEAEFNMAVAMSPYLTAAEMAAFWKMMDAGAGIALATPVERQCIDFFRAVGARDAGKMAAGARTILGGGYSLALSARKFLLVSGMLGAVAQGDRAGAAELWSRYGAELFNGNEPDLVFRLLAAESSAR